MHSMDGWVAGGGPAVMGGKGSWNQATSWKSHIEL